MTVTGTFEVTWFVADERTCNNAADVVTAFGQLFTGNFTQVIQTVQPESLFVAGDLEYGVSRGVENRLAGFHVLFAQFIQDNGTGRVAVAKVTRQFAAFYQGVEQLLWEAILFVAEVTPIEQYRHTGDFPVA